MTAIVLRARLKAQAGKEAEFRAWVNELVNRIEAKDPGTLAFGFYPDPSGDYTVYEVYRDSAAALAHSANVGDLLARMGDFVEPPADPLEVYGAPSDELREVYKQWNAAFFPALRDI